ncbi:hypothetical protein BDW68DRAFT_178632 [Aspergillus falconensis]
MTTYILTGTFRSDLSPPLTEESSHQTCSDFAARLHTLGFQTYDVRTGYLASSNEWRICIVLSGFPDQMPSLVALNDIRALFDLYVVSETVSAQWVVELSDCHLAIPNWEVWATHGTLACETRLARDHVLGEVY